MKLTPEALLLLALLAPAVAHAQPDGSHDPVALGWAITGEAGGAILVGYALGGGAVAGTYFLLARDDVDPEWGNLGAVVMAVAVGAVVLPSGCALGTWGAGSVMHQSGRFWPSLLGAGCGMFAGGVACYAAVHLPHAAPVFYSVALACPPAGAVIGYNMGRPTDASYGGTEQRLEMPRMAMTMTHDELNRPVPGVRCDIVSLKF